MRAAFPVRGMILSAVMAVRRPAKQIREMSVADTISAL